MAFFCWSLIGLGGCPDLVAIFCMFATRFCVKSSPAWLGAVDFSSTRAKRAGALVSEQRTVPVTVLPTTAGVCWDFCAQRGNARTKAKKTKAKRVGFKADSRAKVSIHCALYAALSYFSLRHYSSSPSTMRGSPISSGSVQMRIITGSTSTARASHVKAIAVTARASRTWPKGPSRHTAQ